VEKTPYDVLGFCIFLTGFFGLITGTSYLLAFRVGWIGVQRASVLVTCCLPLTFSIALVGGVATRLGYSDFKLPIIITGCLLSWIATGWIRKRLGWHTGESAAQIRDQ
jgi:hypothetical protein